MLSCKDVTARASDLIDGNLPFWESVQMRFHLAMCKGCAAFVGQLRATQDITRAVAEAESRQAMLDARMEALFQRLTEERTQGL